MPDAVRYLMYSLYLLVPLKCPPVGVNFPSDNSSPTTVKNRGGHPDFMELFWAIIRPLGILSPLNSFFLRFWNKSVHFVSIPDVAKIRPERLLFSFVP